MNESENKIDFDNFSSKDDQLPEEISHALDWSAITGKSKEIASPIADFLYITKECINRLDSKILNNKENCDKDKISNYVDVIQNFMHQKLEKLDNFHEKDFVLRYKKESKDRILAKIRSLNDPSVILGFEYVLDEILAKEKFQAELENLAAEESVELSDLYDSVAIANIENSLNK